MDIAVILTFGTQFVELKSYKATDVGNPLKTQDLSASTLNRVSVSATGGSTTTCYHTVNQSASIHLALSTTEKQYGKTSKCVLVDKWTEHQYFRILKCITVLFIQYTFEVNWFFSPHFPYNCKIHVTKPFPWS